MSVQRRGPTVYELLSKPFGPFLDSTILSPQCNTTPQKPVELRDVLLLDEHGQPTGLTFCEWSQPECPRHQHLRPEDADSGRADNVQLRGLLYIKKAKWLSEQGRDLLTQALRKRDYDIRRKKHGAATRESNLSLDHVFNKDGRPRRKNTYFRVIIKATKEIPAVYMNSERAPGALVIHTMHCGRAYKVLGMDPRTYRKSHLFLSRHRILYELETIVKLPSSSRSTLSERTPNWFVTQYLEHLLPGDDSADESSASENSESDSSSDDSDTSNPRPNKRRRVRRVTREEVLGLLATHVKWLIVQQRRRRFKIFDPTVWTWLEAQAHKYRPRGSLESVQWGVFRGEPNAFHEDANTASDDSEDAAPPPRRRRARKIRSSVEHIFPPSEEEHEGSPVIDDEHPPPTPEPVPTYENRYDSDFTTSGSSSSNDSSPSSTSSGSLCSRSSSPSPAIAAHMPLSLLKPPTLPPTGRWTCHVHGCLYDIDLTHLRREQAELLHPVDVAFLRARRWGVGDRVVVGCFRRLADAHYREHLAGCGLVVVREGKRYKLKSTIPKCALSSTRHQPTLNTYNSVSVVKEEVFQQD